MVDNHGNTVAQEGCDRCECGCKYWEHDKCIDCGKHVSEIKEEADLEDCLVGEFDRWWEDGPTKANWPNEAKDMFRLAFMGGAEAREALVLKGRVLGLTGLEVV